MEDTEDDDIHDKEDVEDVGDVEDSIEVDADNEAFECNHKLQCCNSLEADSNLVQHKNDVDTDFSWQLSGTGAAPDHSDLILEWLKGFFRLFWNGKFNQN